MKPPTEQKYRDTLRMCLKALKGAYKLPRPWLKYANGRTTFIEWETAVASIDQAILEVEDVLKAEQVGHGESILLNDSEKGKCP